MGDIGLKTECKRCRKCQWCAKYDDYDVLQNTHTPIYYCTVGTFYSKKNPKMTPNLDGDCPCFNEPYKDDEDEE